MALSSAGSMLRFRPGFDSLRAVAQKSSHCPPYRARNTCRGNPRLHQLMSGCWCGRCRGLRRRRRSPLDRWLSPCLRGCNRPDARSFQFLRPLHRGVGDAPARPPQSPRRGGDERLTRHCPRTEDYKQTHHVPEGAKDIIFEEFVDARERLIMEYILEHQPF